MNTEQETVPRETRQNYISQKNKRARFIVNWLFLLGAGLYSLFHVGFVIWQTIHQPDWLLALVKQHFAVLIGLPFAAFGALGLVLLLESHYNQELEFEAVGFQFQGASGPIILWVVCFLSIALCMKLLW
jgi:hypothetical protein